MAFAGVYNFRITFCNGDKSFGKVFVIFRVLSGHDNGFRSYRYWLFLLERVVKELQGDKRRLTFYDTRVS